MDCIVILFYISIFACLIFFRKPEFSKKICLQNTHFVRGIAILFIILHHISQRIEKTSFILYPLLLLVYLAVATFFFCSGYGNFISLKKKDPTKWLIKHMVYLLFFFSIGFVVNIPQSGGKLIDFFTLTYAPYELWFIKVLFCSYLLTWLIWIGSKSDKVRIVSVFFLVLAYYILVVILKLPDYWWNSIIAYPIGMLVNYLEDNGVKKSKRNIAIFVLLFMVSTIIGLKIHFFQILSTMFFCVLLAMYLKCSIFIHRQIFCCLGKLSLGLYLFHVILITYLKLYFNIWWGVPIYLCLLLLFACIIELIYSKTLRRII